jgi:hypothetical protein
MEKFVYWSHFTGAASYVRVALVYCVQERNKALSVKCSQQVCARRFLICGEYVVQYLDLVPFYAYPELIQKGKFKFVAVLNKVPRHEGVGG